MQFNPTHDPAIDLATAPTRQSKRWKNRRWQWSEVLQRCSEPTRTAETAAQYAAMERDEQSTIKDVGGFVAGYLKDGVRKTANVAFRTAATLDLDHCAEGQDVWGAFTRLHGCAALLYSTHKHTPQAPRYRLVIPFSRKVTPDEYEPICRSIADTVGIDSFDDTTYELARLFYWPSAPKDGEFVFRWQDGEPLDPDQVLATYADHRDASGWPTSSRETPRIRREITKAGDPAEKPGVIGAFCRAYPIEDAITAFLGSYYAPTDTPGRYTYRQGSVAGGLVCYDGKFAYSHHETDPAGKQLCNAFDLCRIHLFGDRDEKSRATDITRLPSYAAMQELAAKDGEVKVQLAKERRESINADFGGYGVEDAETVDDRGLLMLLTPDGKGTGFANTINNVVAILENHPYFKGRLRHNDFTGADEVDGGLPWNAEAARWTDTDDANLRTWLERQYGITGREKVMDAVTAVMTAHRYHPIRQYLEPLQWDGVPRLARLVVDYIGAEDNPLTRAMTLKHFTAAVARVFEPGCKYDYCLVLTGPEGAGKSTLLNVMGGQWFNDSVTTTEGKEGMEQVRCAWVIELGELAGIKTAFVESVKAFLSKRVDIYRAAYGRRVQEHPRQCVFCGSTNEAKFLKGNNGNRRFWVIEVRPELRKYPDWRERLEADRDQLWAEALYHYRHGEKLYLDDTMEMEARKRQAEANSNADDPMPGLLDVYLETPLPADWKLYGLEARQRFYNDPENDPENDRGTGAVGTVRRDRVCAAEFLCEMMKVPKTDKEFKYRVRTFNELMRGKAEWEYIATSKHAKRLYGVQRAFRRKAVPEDDDI